MPVQKTKEEREARREEVREFMETVGPYSVPIKMLAGKHKVTIKVIYNDIEFWIKKLDFSKISNEGKKLLMGIKKNLSLVESMRLEGSPGDKMKAIKLANETAEVYTKLMEQFGFKEKVADKFEHSGKVFNVKITEVESGSDNKSANEQKAETSVDNSPR